MEDALSLYRISGPRRRLESGVPLSRITQESASNMIQNRSAVHTMSEKALGPIYLPFVHRYPYKSASTTHTLILSRGADTSPDPSCSSGSRDMTMADVVVVALLTCLAALVNVAHPGMPWGSFLKGKRASSDFFQRPKLDFSLRPPFVSVLRHGH